MHVLRIPIVLGLILAWLAIAAPTAADQPPSSQAIRISGVVRPDQPTIFRRDPVQPWLVAQPGCPSARMTPGRLLDPPRDPVAPWLVDESAIGVQRWRGAQFEGPLDLAEPRSAGRLSMLWNTDVHTLAGTSASDHVVAVRLEVGGGSWVGTLTGTGDPASGSFRIGGSMDGTGAFEDGTLIVDIQCVGPGSAWRVEGLAVMGDLPPSAAFVR
jgi:hypothetical protein